MSASIFGSGFGGGGGGGGSVTFPITIAQGGTGQTTANAGLNALQALTLAQNSTLALLDNVTNTAPVVRVLKHTSSGTTAAGFGVGSAVDLQNNGAAHGGVGQVVRAMTDAVLFTSATDGAEQTRRDITTMVNGALQNVVSLGTTPTALSAIYVGNPANACGMVKATDLSAFALRFVLNNAGYLTIGNNQIFASARVSTAQGSAAASASTLTLAAATSGGNFSHVTGTTTTSFMATADWQAGSQVTLLFEGALTLVNNASSPPGGTFPFLLQGGTNFSTAANNTITLVMDGTLSRWVEIGRRT